MRNPYLILCILMPFSAMAQTDNNAYKFHIGTMLDNEILQQVSDITIGRSPLYRYSLNTTVKYFLNKSNSINFAGSIGSRFTSININYIYPRSYPAQFLFAAGWEHSFFAASKFNLLAGASLFYVFRTYEGDVLVWPDAININVSSIGAGFNVGCRYNISHRFSLEANIGMFHYTEIDERYKLVPYSYYHHAYGTIINKDLSLELFYHFNIPGKK